MRSSTPNQLCVLLAVLSCVQTLWLQQIAMRGGRSWTMTIPAVQRCHQKPWSEGTPNCCEQRDGSRHGVLRRGKPRRENLEWGEVRWISIFFPNTYHWTWEMFNHQMILPFFPIIRSHRAQTSCHQTIRAVRWPWACRLAPDATVLLGNAVGRGGKGLDRLEGWSKTRRNGDS